MSPYIRVPGAAAKLDVSTRTVYRLIADGSLPAYRIGRSVRVRRTDLDAIAQPVHSAGDR